MPLAPRYRWFTIALLVASAFYAWYIIAEYDRLNDLNQRQLSNAASDLKATLETAMETVHRFDSRVTEAQPKPAAKNHASQSSLCVFDASQPYLDVAGCTSPESTQPSWDKGLRISGVADSTLGIQAARSNQSGQTNPPPLQFQFRADVLFQELASVDPFELIFVANKTGKILYQDAPAGRRWLRYLRWAEQTSRDPKADRPPALRIQNVRDVIGGSASTWDQSRAVSSRTSLRLGGTAYQLYLQPVGSNEKGWEDLVIGAVVPTNWIVRDALALDTDLLALLVFAVLLGLLGFPFVKLSVLHRHERFRMRDVMLLYLSTGALLVLVTCASFALDGYRRWHWTADLGLQRWAEYLSESLVKELGQIRDQLVGYDELLLHNHNLSKACGTVEAGWFGQKRPNDSAIPSWMPPPPRAIYLRQVGWIRFDGQQEWKATADPIPGLIRVNQRPYIVAVQAGRLFEIAEEQGLESAQQKNRPFFFGPDRSITDGKFYTFVSIRSDLLSTTCADDRKHPVSPSPKAIAQRQLTSIPSVLAASGLLLSLDRQPMPAGYGFALVNREGHVLYHSDRRLSLRENLFDELSQSARVRALIYAAQGDWVSTRYRERAHEFYLKPIGRLRRYGEKGPAFYIVTFRDTSVERAIVGHEFIAGLVGPMLVLLTFYSIGLALMAARFGVKDRWGAWLWPDGGLEPVYRRQAIALGALLLVTLVVCNTRYATGAVLAGLPAGVVGAAIYLYGKRNQPDRCRLTRVHWHVAALLLLIVCMVIVPSAVLFRLALHHEFGKLIHTEGAWIAAQREDAPRDAGDDIPREYYDEDLRCAHVTARRSLYSERALPAPFDWDLPSEASRRAAPTVRLAGHRDGAGDDIAVTITDDCRGTTSGLEIKATSGAASSHEKPSLATGELWLVNHLDWVDEMLPIENEIASRTHFEESQHMYSPGGTLPLPLPMSLIAFVGLGLMLALLAWWIRWNANRLFFADYEPGTGRPVVSAPFEPILHFRRREEQILLLQIAREHIANPGQRPVVEDLLDDGLLRLCPDLRPWPPEFDKFLLTMEKTRHAEVVNSEHVTDTLSWHSVRLILAMSVAGLGFFLVATQPGLQSTVLGIASGLTSALTTGVKLRDAAASWLPGRKASGA